MDILYDDIELNKNYMNYGHDLTLSTWKQEAGARFTESYERAPMLSAGRMYEMTYSKLDEEAPHLTEDEWKESIWYRPGLQFKDGVNETVAALTADRKDDERERQDVMSRAPKGIMRAGSMFAVDFAAQFMDPLNIASAFVPIVGAGKFASMTGKYGITRARAMSGAVEGLAGAAMIEPLVYAASKQEQSDYGMYDSLLAVGFGAGFGSVLHVGVGKLGDVLGISPYAQGKIMEDAITGIVHNVLPDPTTYLNAGYDPTRYRLHGPRETLMKQIQESGKFSDESIGAVFKFMDTVSESAYNRGLTDDVEAYYSNILDKTGGKRVVVSKDVENFAQRIIDGEDMSSPTDRQFHANNQVDIERVLRREYSDLAGEAGATFEYFSDGLTDIVKAFKTGDVKEVIRGMVKYLPDQTVRTEKELNLFVRSFEKYLMEGKAPSAELQPMFNTFSRALLAVYENVADDHFVRTDFNTSKVKAAYEAVVRTSTERDEILTGLKRLLRDEETSNFSREGAVERAETPELAREEIKRYDAELKRIQEQRNALSAQLKDIDKIMAEQEKIYKQAKEESTFKIEITPEMRETFDKLLALDIPPVERVVPEAELKRTTERTGTTKEVDEFAYRVDTTNIRLNAGKESPHSNYKNVTEEVKELKKMLDARRDSGEMTQAQHDIMSRLVTNELDAVERNMDFVDGILNCIL